MDFSAYGLPELVYIVTPGHSPGHISLLHAPSRTMLGGDVLSFIKPSLRRAREGDASDKRVGAGLGGGGRRSVGERPWQRWGPGRRVPHPHVWPSCLLVARVCTQVAAGCSRLGAAVTATQAVVPQCGRPAALPSCRA